MDVKFLEKLSNADALAGSEREVRDLMHKELKALVDDVFCDKLGSIIFEKKGKSESPKIMIAAHMDEVGFKVRNILENGLIIVKAIGKVKPLAKFMQDVRITTSDGKKIKGVLHSTWTEDEDIKNFPGKTYVDIGVDSEDEVRKLGIEVGNIICFDTMFETLHNNLVKGKAFDDRLGCYVLARVLEKVSKKTHENCLYFCATSSEEIGRLGGKTCASLVDPDIAFIVDATCYADQFDTSNENTRRIGKGFLLFCSDREQEANEKLLKYVKESAQKLKKNAHLDMLVTGSTDGSMIQVHGDGVPTQVCILPLRYGHCSSSIANMKDIEDLIDVIVEMICNLDAKSVKEISSFI